MKLIISFLILFCALLSESCFSQDITFRLCGNTNSCGFSIQNPSNTTLLRIGGNGSFASMAPFYINAPQSNDTIMVVKHGTGLVIASAYDNGNKTHVFGELSVDTFDANVTNEINFIRNIRILSGCYTGSWNQCSDIKLKKNINKIQNPLEKVLRLNGVTYQWRKDDFPAYKFDEGEKIGLIAQEVEKVFPELVRTENDGIKSVNYANMTAVLIEAMKEQQKIIDEQNHKLHNQENELKELKTKQASLEKEMSKQKETISSMLQKMEGK